MSDTRTVQSFNPEPRPWESKYGPMASFTVTFTDGTKGSLNCKADKVEERKTTLQGLIGKDVTVEDAGKFEDGNPKPFKIVDYPGKPQTQQGRAGGGGGYKGFQPDPQRYATDAAVSLAQTAWRLPDGATENRTKDQAQGAADAMLAFVCHAIPKLLDAIGSPVVSSAAGTASPTPLSEDAKPNGAEDKSGISAPSAPEGTCKDGNHSGPFVDPPNPEAGKRGIVMCSACGLCGKFATQGALA